jgi:DNA-binding NarL/FixJ family response regulator
VRTFVSAHAPDARAALAALLEADARIEVVGESSPDDLGAAARASDPEVVVEQRDGPSEAAAFPTVALVDDPRAALAAEGFGARGRGGAALLSRDATADEIVGAVLAVAAGLIAVQPRALGFGDDALAPAPERERVRGNERLSPREVEVLAELARGSANKQVAAKLRISEHTVKFHIASIFGKLGVASRTEAVTAGVRRGLIML